MNAPPQKRHLSLPYLLGFALITASPVIAASQGGFGRVANQPYSGGVTVINNMKRPQTPADALKSGNLSVTGALKNSPATTKSAPVAQRTLFVDLRPILIARWQQARPVVVDSAMAFLHERDIGGGFRTSRNRLTLAEDGPMFVGWDGRGFTIRMLLNGNRLSTYLRTPTPLDRDMDPGFNVNFDLDVSIDVEVKGTQLVAGPARIQPRVHPPTGRNVTGSLAVAANNLVGVLSGTDFVGSLLRQVNSRNIGFDTGLNQALARLNPVLQAAASGGTIMPGYNAGRSSITLTMQNAGPPPVVR